MEQLEKLQFLFKGSTIELWIDNPQGRVNGEPKWIDENNHNVKPIIIMVEQCFQLDL